MHINLNDNSNQSYVFDGVVLDQVEVETDLGVFVTANLDWRDNTGCPKSHYTKVRAYCSACDHLICKISSGMFQKSSSFEEFNGFSEIDVHFFK